MIAMDTKPIGKSLDDLVAGLEKELLALEGEEKKLVEEIICALKKEPEKGDE